MDIEAIRTQLGTMKKVPGRDHYEWKVGRFTLHIFTSPRSFRTDESILRYETVDVNVNEFITRAMSSADGTMFLTNWISIREDEPFKNYEPIQYNIVCTPNGRVNLSDGTDMPIQHLCELIHYLYRLSKLTAFE
jgi:hypothetical protein